MVISFRVLLHFTLLFGSIFVGTACADQSTLDNARHQAAIRDARSMLDASKPADAGSVVRLGDALLRGGYCDEAVEQFERAIEMRPEMEPYLWQHGIALFLVGRYSDAKSIFEKHRIVNPHDVENAAWHFLCVAKANDVDTARQILLPAPGDRRVPMKEILQRLSGGNSKAIEAAVQGTRGTPAHENASLYGDLYIGLIADAEGDRDLAKKHLSQADRSELTHYMADVASVYASTVDAR